MAAGYEDCNDAEFLRIDPALRLASLKIFASGQPIHALRKEIYMPET